MIQDIAPHRYDPAYRTPKVKESDKVLIYRENGLLCHMEENEIEYVSVKEITEIYPDIDKEAVFLFRIDGQNYFTLQHAAEYDFRGFAFVSKDTLRAVRPIWRAFAGITGFQIHNWYDQNRYCGFCKTKLLHVREERALKCPNCGRILYPQICPSIIAGIINGDQILLTKYTKGHSNFRKYALVAGYVEVGESLEDALRREVMEEVGLSVKNIRYYKSQPWSFTNALLVGFFCDVDKDADIKMDQTELSEAEWFDRDFIPMERSESEISLTGEMIDAFIKKQI